MLKSIPRPSNRILPAKSSDFPSGLVLHYDMQDLGLKIIDKSGMGHHGVLSGDAAKQQINCMLAPTGGTFTIQIESAIDGSSVSTSAINYNESIASIALAVYDLIYRAGYTNAGARITCTGSGSGRLDQGANVILTFGECGSTVIPLMTKTSSFSPSGAIIITQEAGGFPLSKPASNGYSRYFDGVDDKIIKAEVLGSNVVPPNSSFTIAVWFKIAKINANQYLISKALSAIPFNMYISSASNKLVYYVSDGTNASNMTGNPTVFATGIWYHIVCRLDISQVGTPLNNTVFANGVPYNSSTNTSVSGAAQSTTSILIGAGEYGNYLNGNIGDLKIFSRALTNNEIKELFQNEAWIYGLSS